ncbi:MAG: hypothetical protein ACKVQK_25985 [Burkholderiales bacterium]
MVFSLKCLDSGMGGISTPEMGGEGASCGQRAEELWRQDGAMDSGSLVEIRVD